MDFSENLRVQLTNQLFFIGIILNIIHEIVNITGPNSIFDHGVSTVWITLFLAGFMMNKYQKPFLSRIIIMSSCIAFTGLVYFWIGLQARLEPLYLLLLLLSVYLFERTGIFFFSLATITSYIAVRLSILNIGAPFKHLFVESQSLGYFVFSISIMLVLTSKMLSENKKNNRIITDQNERLANSNEQLKRFNYIVAHDLKEPVRSIVSFSNLLKRYKDKPEKSEEFINFIIKSGNQLNNLIDGIRDFQEIENMNIKNEVVCLNTVVENITTSLNGFIIANNATISCDKGLPYIYSAPFPLFIVLKNLIENGIKYNDSDSPMVRIYAKKQDDLIKIYVEDNGIGIAEEYFEQVFIMFKQLGTSNEKGSGLGLNIAKDTLHKMGGTLQILQSKPGRGSVFLITIPALDIPKEALSTYEQERIEQQRQIPATNF